MIKIIALFLTVSCVSNLALAKSSRVVTEAENTLVVEEIEATEEVTWDYTFEEYSPAPVCSDAPSLDVATYQIEYECVYLVFQDGKPVEIKRDMPGSGKAPFRKVFVGPGANAACSNYLSDRALEADRKKAAAENCKAREKKGETFLKIVVISNTASGCTYEKGEWCPAK